MLLNFFFYFLETSLGQDEYKGGLSDFHSSIVLQVIRVEKATACALSFYYLNIISCI